MSDLIPGNTTDFVFALAEISLKFNTHTGCRKGDGCMGISL